jgi:hypothetical protein
LGPTAVATLKWFGNATITAKPNGISGTALIEYHC